MARLAQKIVLAAFLTALASPATAADRCAVSTLPVAFGGYDPFAGPRDASGAVQIDCNGNAGALVQLGAGQSGDAGDRRMRSGSEELRYNVYSDAGRTQVFTSVSTGGWQQTVALHGRIFAGQPVAPGAYQDLLTVTVQF